MSILGNFDRMASLFGLAPKAQVQRRVQLPPWASEGGWSDLQDPDRSTYERQAEQFKASPAFFASLTRIAETAATAKLAVFDGFEEDAEAYETHPFIDLLRQPAPGMEWLALDRFTLIESIVASLGISGDAFLYLGGRSDPSQPPGMLIPLRPDRVELVGQGSVVTGYAYTVMGRTWPISPADIVHFKRYNPSNDLYGLGQADAASLATEADVSAQRHNRALFRNQARLSTVIESDEQFIDEDQRKTMEKWFKDKFTGGPDKAGQVAFLWAGFKARDMGMSQRDAEYIAGRKMNREDIFMTMGVHPALMLSDDVPLANARTAEYLVGKYTLAPMLTRIANRLNAEVLTLYGPTDNLRFLDVVPRDTQQQLQQHTTYLDRAVITINEARNDLGMQPVEWGDKTWPEYQAEVGKSAEPEPQPGDDEKPDEERQPLQIVARQPAPADEDAAVDDADLETPKLLHGAPAELQALFLAAARVVARG